MLPWPVAGPVVAEAAPLMLPAGAQSEFDRVLVVASRFLGAGFIAYLCISIPAFGQPPGTVAAWFTPVAVVLAFGPGIALLAVTFARRRRRLLIQLAAAGTAVGYLLALGLWFVAWTGVLATTENVLWLKNFTGLPAITVATVFGIRRGGAVLLATSTLGAWAVYTGRAPEVQVSLVADAVFGVLFSSTFMLGMWMATRTGRMLDETLPGAVAAAAESASAEARHAERARFDALIHDQVIATLVAAGTHAGDPRLPAQARSALAELDRLAAGGVSHDAEIAGGEAVARLRSMVAGIDPDTPVDVDSVGGTSLAHLHYPEGVIRALAEAVGEAVRNSLRHAGDAAQRAVLIELADDEIRVTVVDDGVGFDVAAVPPRRLGIEVSIRRRVESVGGWAGIRSASGRGTTVQVAWERQP